jgi:mRNA-degrading endonuclease toxin of MazEF toxin-antitoxin module
VAIPDKLSLGDIILVIVREPIHRQPVDPHYAVILSDQNAIDAGDDLIVAVCTTSFHLPHSGWFPMPAAPGGHPITGLTEACVVKATWIDDAVPQSSVLKRIGRSRKREYRLVVNWLSEKERQMERDAKP